MAKLMMTGAAKTAGKCVIGGVPTAPAGTAWPKCSTCEGPMQFLASIPIAEAGDEFAGRADALLVFQCQNDPGLCDEFAPDSGGNAVLTVPANGTVEMTAPPLTAAQRKKGLAGSTALDERKAISLIAFDDTGKDAYIDALDEHGHTIVGKVGGRPQWLQGEETPKCSCRRKMKFVAQIEYYAAEGINFGDAGTGYVFACDECADKAKFLWQCG